MTHPLTPREKVARMAAEAFHNGYQSYDQCDETMRMRFDWIADMIVGSPALASGSGDHAELARLAEAAEAEAGNDDMWVAVKTLNDFNQAAHPATVLALLAENAALRAEASDLREHRITADLLVSSLKSDLAEAESKLAEAEEDKGAAFERLNTEINQHGDTLERLAEAVGLLGDVVFVRKDNAGRSAEYMLSEVITKARAFLSKEAERG